MPVDLDYNKTVRFSKPCKMIFEEDVPVRGGRTPKRGVR